MVLYYFLSVLIVMLLFINEEKRDSDISSFDYSQWKMIIIGSIIPFYGIIILFILKIIRFVDFIYDIKNDFYHWLTKKRKWFWKK